MQNDTEFTLLIVDDEKNFCQAMKRYFTDCPYRLLFAGDGSAALETLGENRADLMLLDIKMPGMNGLDVLEQVMNNWPGMDVIILTAHGGVKEAVSAIKLGAMDVIEKTTAPDVLVKKVDQVYQMWRLARENRKLRRELDARFQFDELIGEASTMLTLKDMIARVAPTDASILIQGESGTGKELVARAIHANSDRKSAVFIPVDCAAINETIMESELFGHHKGAFTGADQSTLGLIRSAHKGTLFLDEVGELPMNMQAKLLRTIQERIVRPVGATRAVDVDIRIVAATNRNLLEAIEKGCFRQDLYYRLSAITLHVPPLRDRSSDIDRLSRHFIKGFTRPGAVEKKLSDKALTILETYHWPGNVRELCNVIQGAMAFSRPDIILPADLEKLLSCFCAAPEKPAEVEPELSSYEEDAIRKALERTSGNRRNAAKLLSISEATLYRKIKRYKI